MTHDEIVTMTNGILEVLDVDYTIADEKIDSKNKQLSKIKINIQQELDKANKLFEKK